DLYMEKYNELSGQVLNGLSSKNREEDSLKSEDIFQVGLTNSFKSGAASGNITLVRVVKEEVNSASSRVYKNPATDVDEINRCREFIKSLPALYDNENSMKAAKSAEGKIAMSAINGLADKGQYEKAKSLIEKE